MTSAFTARRRTEAAVLLNEHSINGIRTGARHKNAEGLRWIAKTTIGQEKAYFLTFHDWLDTNPNLIEYKTIFD